MTKFYNPYQFVPVTGRINSERIRVDYADIIAGNSEPNATVRHDLWHKDGLSGRIVCSLHLETPTIVGASQIKGDNRTPSIVEQYTWRNKPAIPASSIKGMISSIAETLSQSTLRILDEGKELKMRIKKELGDTKTTKVTLPRTIYEYFDNIDEDLNPWSKDRNHLTPAELLFGMVEINEKDENPDGTRNLSGRLRFSDATTSAATITQLAEVTLKTLNSPSLPSPAMYFHEQGRRGEYLSKESIYSSLHHLDTTPNGRKQYLHHSASQIHQESWLSTNDKHDNLKIRCQPMEAKQTFYFHIDFNNLSKAELTLLETSLMPGEGFQHRLGLGKSLGLGSISLGIQCVSLVDRQTRYSLDALHHSEERHQTAWRPEQITDEKEGWHTEYPTEWKALNKEKAQHKPTELQDNALIDQETLQIIKTLGDPASLEPGVAVHTPLTETQIKNKKVEDETFQWFNENDAENGQALSLIIPGQPLPPLHTTLDEATRAAEEAARCISDPLLAELIEVVKEKDPQEVDKILIGTPLANAILDTEDSKLQQALYLEVKKTCQKRGLFIGNKALKKYQKITT